MEIEETIRKLKKSALFAMSLGSMELFHSNFWRWLIEFKKEYIKVFFNELGNIESDKIIVKREFKHTDISIEVDGNYYLIENKFKSLVDDEQLEKYSSDFEDKYIFIKGKYLFPINVDVNRKEEIKRKWEFLNYKTVIDEIDKITESIFPEEKDKNDTNYKIIKEYTEMTNNIIQLLDHAVNHFYKNKFIVKGKEDDFFKTLKEIRIYDIVRKINCDLLKKKLEERLQKEFGALYSNITIEQGFSTGQASLSARWKFKYDDSDESKGYFLIGPQLQDYQFRTMIHICTKYFSIDIKKLKAKGKKEIDAVLERVYDSVKKDIFEKGELYYKSKFKKPYNEYKGTHDNHEYVALYKYKRIDNYKKNNQEIDLSNFDKLCDEFINLLYLYKDINKESLINLIKDGLINVSIE